MKQQKITLTILGLLTSASSLPTEVLAHGTMVVPESRVYNCRFNDNPENPQDPACRAAVQISGPQMLYDWNGINQAAAGGNSRMLIPDGQLCGGGKAGFQGMNLPRSDWRATAMQSGQFEFQYHATAPHATKDTMFYITRNGWNPGQPLRWADLEEFCRQGQQPLVPGVQGKNVYKYNCTIPAKTGRHVIYAVWQRSDSTEAFYSCNDVQFSGASTPTPTTPPTKPPVVTSNYKAIGTIANPQDLPVGTKLAFRLFDENAADIETTRITLGTGQTVKTLWPAVLAQAVNAQSRYARIGVQNAKGNIVPTQQLGANAVFINASRSYSFAIDKTIPAKPSTGATVTYPQGIGTYRAGTVVKGKDGVRYQCRPYPNSGWCNLAPQYYAPGTGWAWQDAWSRL